MIGHHVDKNAASPLNYSRDEATRLCALIFGVLELIRLGDLVPDQARVARLADLNGQSEPQGAEAEAVSSDESSTDIDDDDTEAIAAVEHSLLRAPLVEPDARGCANDVHLRHRVSGVVHVEKDLFALLCGRSRTENYEGLPEGSQLDAFCLCKQCATVDPSFGHKED